MADNAISLLQRPHRCPMIQSDLKSKLWAGSMSQTIDLWPYQKSLDSRESKPT